MALLVVLQGRRLMESQCANLAFVGTLSCVNPRVDHQVSLLREGLGTDPTGVGPLACMRPLVVL